MAHDSPTLEVRTGISVRRSLFSQCAVAAIVLGAAASLGLVTLLVLSELACEPSSEHQRSCRALAADLEAFSAKHGHPPSRLEELVPEFRPALPGYDSQLHVEYSLLTGAGWRVVTIDTPEGWVVPSVEDGSTQPTVASAWRLCLSEDWWSCSFLSVYRSDHDYASYAQQEDFRVTEDGWASFASCE